MLERPEIHESLDWKAAESARRFECGSLNRLGIHAMCASLGLLLEVGITSIHEMIDENISYICEKAKECNIDIISNMDQNRAFRDYHDYDTQMSTISCCTNTS